MNNVVRLVPGSNGNSKSDFSRINVGTVVPLYCTLTGLSQDPTIFTNSSAS